MRILLVDDNPIDLLVNQKVVSSIFPKAEVLQEQSAQDALNYLQKAKMENRLPDFVLLDIKMPILTGFDFLERVETSEDKELQAIKVIMVSSSIDPADQEKASNSPLVFDFLEKPLVPQKLKTCGVLFKN
jgi:CheY-like chemotaxis protein